MKHTDNVEPRSDVWSVSVIDNDINSGFEDDEQLIPVLQTNTT